MQITPVNSTNFNGNLKKTTELTKFIKYSDKNSLIRLDNVLKKASKNNDGKIYKITSITKTTIKNNGLYYKTDFMLNDINIPIETGTLYVKHKYEMQNDNKDDYNKIFDLFISKLESIYNEENFTKTKNEIIKSINSNLI